MMPPMMMGGVSWVLAKYWNFKYALMRWSQLEAAFLWKLCCRRIFWQTPMQEEKTTHG